MNLLLSSKLFVGAFGILMASSSAFGTHYLVAKCTVTNCENVTSEGSGDGCGYFEGQYDHLEFYRYSGVDQSQKSSGLLGMNTHANPSDLGHKAFELVTLNEQSHSFEISPKKGSGVSSFSIPKGYRKSTTVDVDATYDGRLKARYSLICMTTPTISYASGE